MRPLNESLDDIKNRNPVAAWKNSFPDGEMKKRYCMNCDSVAEILQEFIDYIDGGGKISSAEVKKLSAKLNKFNEQTQFFDTMEAEDLYLWFVKYFKAINYPKAVDIIDETRDW